MQPEYADLPQLFAPALAMALALALALALTSHDDVTSSWLGMAAQAKA